MRGLAVLLAGLLGVASAQGGRLDVVVSDARDRASLPAVFEAWRGAGRDLRALGLTLPGTRLEAAASADDFARRTGESWFVAAVTRTTTTQGTVIHTQRLSALAARGTLRLTLRHEAFHAAQPRGLPRWLAEGLARLFSGEAGGDPPGPTGLERVPEGELSARLAARLEGDLRAASREATRRAKRLVETRGWARVLAVRRAGEEARTFQR